MSRVINISLSIPISNGNWDGPSITFYKWIPEDTSDAIIVSKGSKEISIGIDKSCISSFDDVTDERISRLVNISVTKLNVNVLVKDLDDDLVNFIFDERERPMEIHHGLKPGENGYDALNEKYKSLGIEVADIAYFYFNRVIMFARNAKAQYWLTEKNLNKNWLNNLNNQFKAKVKIDNGDWFRWCPPNDDCIIINVDTDDSAITREDWRDLSEFVISSDRTNLTFELIANSRQLFDKGHRRSSVIEAVTALEVAVSKFGKKPNIEILSTIIPIERLDLKRLGAQIKHLGFSGSIRYLIPLLIPQTVLPEKVLIKCFDALKIRNNVVHQGQRDVPFDLGLEILRDVEFFCRVLESYTIK